MLEADVRSSCLRNTDSHVFRINAPTEEITSKSKAA